MVWILIFAYIRRNYYLDSVLATLLYYNIIYDVLSKMKITNNFIQKITKSDLFLLVLKIIFKKC